jgi:hypothetical protein
MSDLINFLFNSTINPGILFCLELSNLSKKDSVNEYFENKIIIQFYGTHFFLIFHKENRYKGILIGFPILDFIKPKSTSSTFSNRHINGILIVFKEQTSFEMSRKLIIKIKDFKKRHQKFIETEKLLYYLVDRKKKKNTL